MSTAQPSGAMPMGNFGGGGGGAPGTTQTQTYAFAGGAHDYTADSGWTSPPTAIGSEATQSGQLGDGTDHPLFFAWARSQVSALARTSSGKLRLTIAANLLPDAWPINSAAASTAIVPQWVRPEGASAATPGL